MKSYFTIVTLLVAITLCGAQDSEEGTQVLQPRDFWTVPHDGPFQLRYAITSDTTDIDVYLLSETNYHDWVNSAFNSPNYIPEASKLGTRDAKLSAYDINRDDTFYVVMFNTNYIKSTKVHYDIDFALTRKASLRIWAVLLIILGGIILVMGLGGMIYYVFRGHHRYDREPLLANRM